MCGIVAVLPCRSERAVPSVPGCVELVEHAAGELCRLQVAEPGGAWAGPLGRLADRLEGVDASLRGVAGLRGLLAAGAEVGDRLEAASARLGDSLDRIEADLDAGVVAPGAASVEAINAAVVRLRDVAWALGRDRVGSARAVADLCPAGLDPVRHPAALEVLWAVQVALASLDRLEVRGRDSAGLQILLAGHGLGDAGGEVLASLRRRRTDPLYASQAARVDGTTLSLVYKAAAEIGELGDNVAALRAAIRSDRLLGAALAAPAVRASVLAHTRWASVGAVSEANAHPLDSAETTAPPTPLVVAALNGDIDNHAELSAGAGLRLAEAITTDAKVIPVLVARRMAAGEEAEAAFLATVRSFEGSVAVAACAAADPDRLHLALKGSGQALYVGLAPDAYVVASEPYGLVEETSRYLRMDGESTQGQVVVVERAGGGGLAGLSRRRYDGGELPIGAGEILTTEITTRDIDRRGFPHFFSKEISEAPSSLRKTLRGKLRTGLDGRLEVALGSEVVPPELVAALAGGGIRRVLAIGQGTAAVAARSVAAAFARLLPGVGVEALPASEVSGFGLRDDMSDTLVVAISQSGTTTDTNRTVDLVRARRAHVLAVVNRRGADLATKAHGTLYTSDGRDVEMSVASTKAFYAQVAAGWLLAAGLAAAAGRADREDVDGLLAALRALPEAMEVVLARQADIGRIAGLLAPGRRYWTVVGSGPDALAAAEVRIKLSELCYRSVAFDTIEDKKHIDLSCEPLILVCAAGLSGPTADDVAKEVGIYRAHKAAPVVIVSEPEADRFAGGAEVVTVPAVRSEVAFVLSAMVGHLFGYEAALAIDAQARPLRAVRAGLDAAVGLADDEVLAGVGPAVASAAAPFLAGVAAGSYDGNLDASDAVRLVSLLRYATGVSPVESYELETGKVGSPRVILADLLDASSRAIDALTRPVDAIKHQAKTVTVGTSRSEDALLSLPLVAETLAAGASADLLGYRALRTLGRLDPAVEAVLGYTRYRIEWPGEPGGWPTATVCDRAGVAAGLTSRTAVDPRLRGTKHRAAEEREVTVARGASDGRTVVMVPEVKANAVVGMTLLHVRFAATLDAVTAREVLSGYRGRYAALRDAVTETEPTLDDDLLAEVPLVDLLTEPVYVLAERWRARRRSGR